MRKSIVIMHECITIMDETIAPSSMAKTNSEGVMYSIYNFRTCFMLATLGRVQSWVTLIDFSRSHTSIMYTITAHLMRATEHSYWSRLEQVKGYHFPVSCGNGSRFDKKRWLSLKKNRSGNLKCRVARLCLVETVVVISVCLVKRHVTHSSL